ncbi:MAG: hypothetical protein AB1299_02150 [Thermoproteota archaeon]
MKSRRAVSEIVSAMVIIAVVASGLGLYVTLSEQRILSETQSVKDVMETSEDQLSEIIEHLATLKKNREVSFFVYNYGLKNITVSDVFVNGTKNMNDVPDGFEIRSLTKADLGSVIPVDMASEIILNFTSYAERLEHVDSIVIRTSSNKLIQLRNGTN